MPLHSIFIVSVPRSGSTVLANLINAYEDVICPPESFFPAVLDQLSDHEMLDRRNVAALFVASCSDGSPLTLDEAERCVLSDKRQTLDALARAVAVKQGRDPDHIRIAVWKFTRMVGCWAFGARIGGKFLVLRRSPLNVYESQFRVPFGMKNRNPFRFALFAASYDAAFSRYPDSVTQHLQYSNIPETLEGVVEWIGSKGVRRSPRAESLEEEVQQSLWHSNVKKPFVNLDHEKLKNLKISEIFCYEISRRILSLLVPLNRCARYLADRRQMQALRIQASHLRKQS